MFSTPTVPVLFALLLASARMCHGYFYLYSRILPHYSYVIFNAVTPPLSSPSPPRMLAAVAVIKVDFFSYYKRTAFTVVSCHCAPAACIFSFILYFILFSHFMHKLIKRTYRSLKVIPPTPLMQFNILAIPCSLTCFLCLVCYAS